MKETSVREEKQAGQVELVYEVTRLSAEVVKSQELSEIEPKEEIYRLLQPIILRINTTLKVKDDIEITDESAWKMNERTT